MGIRKSAYVVVTFMVSKKMYDKAYPKKNKPITEIVETSFPYEPIGELEPITLYAPKMEKFHRWTFNS